jgi:hypothetical protein
MSRIHRDGLDFLTLELTTTSMRPDGHVKKCNFCQVLFDQIFAQIPPKSRENGYRTEKLSDEKKNVNDDSPLQTSFHTPAVQVM